MCYVGPANVRMPEFWVDVGKIDVQPLGWCAQQKERNPDSGVVLDPPELLKEQYPSEDWQQLVKNSIKGKQTLSADSLHSVKLLTSHLRC
jgi:hypothetical protein